MSDIFTLCCFNCVYLSNIFASNSRFFLLFFNLFNDLKQRKNCATFDTHAQILLRK
jgi:hypothetical protein